MFNWVAEAKKFTPELRVLALHGPERHARFRRNRRQRPRGHQLRADPPRRGEISRAGIRHRGARRGPAHQEPPDPKRAGGEGRAGQAPAGADRHAAGKLRARSLVHLRFSHARLSRHGEGFPRALRTAHREGEKRGGAGAAGAAAAAIPAAPAETRGRRGSAGEDRAGVVTAN